MYERVKTGGRFIRMPVTYHPPPAPVPRPAPAPPAKAPVDDEEEMEEAIARGFLLALERVGLLPPPR
jgi:hypothetical protein